MVSNCSCVIFDDYSYDEPAFVSSKIHKARKLHICGECGKTIHPGDEYEYVAGLWSGILGIHKTCEVCLEIRNMFFCEGWAYGEIHQDLYGYINYSDASVSEDCLLELSKKARDIVCGKIERFWRDQYA